MDGLSFQKATKKKKEICGKEWIDRGVEFNWDKTESKGLGALAGNETKASHGSYFFFSNLKRE